MAHLSEKEIASIKRMFLAIDEDGSGEISAFELRNILKEKKLQMTEEEIDKFMEEFDGDGNGTIDLCEFVMMMKNRKNKALIHKAIVLRSAMRNAFRKFDLNGDGFISKKEFKSVLKKQNRGRLTETQLTENTFANG